MRGVNVNGDRKADGEPECESGPRRSQPEFTLRPGTLLERRYEIARFLDRGATASVYLAEDLETDRSVVVKLLEHDAAANPQLRSRFLCGARAAMQVFHPNVVEILSVNDGVEAPYVVMEALVGETLGTALAHAGRISIDTGIALVRQAATGLSALHHAGLVHRDVKPDNLFLVGGAERPHALKVLDFGHAHLTPEVPEQVPEETDTVLGTAQYMAPEQVVGDPVDPRTDIYALGVVMFRMFTGHLPFDLDLGVDLLRHQLASPAPPPSWLLDEMEPAVEALILKAMRKNPRNRQQSMFELLAEIDAISSPRPRLVPGSDRGTTPDLYAPQSPRAVRAVSLLHAAGF